MSATINFQLLIYLLILLGYLFSFGNFSTPGIYILIGTFLIWLLYYLKREAAEKFFNFAPNYMCYVVLVSSFALSFLSFDSTLRQPGILSRPENFQQLVWVMRVILIVSLFLGSLFIYFRNKTIPFLLLLLSALILRILIVIVSPNPRMDVFDFLKMGSLGLVHGLNPYQMTFIPLYPGVAPDYFSYTPGILLLTVPFVLLLHDHRFLFIISEISTAILFYLLGSKKKLKSKSKVTAQILPVIFLFNPISLFIILRGWTDSSLIFILSLLAFLIISKKRHVVTLILLGFAITTKQTMVLAPIFFLKWLKYQWSKVLVVYTVAMIIILPFVLWGPKDFLQDVISFFITYPPRHDGLSINSLFFSLTGKDVPVFMFSTVWLFTAWIIWRHQKNNLDEVFGAMAFWFFGFFLFNKLAFAHYYYFVGSLILLYLTVNTALTKR